MRLKHVLLTVLSLGLLFESAPQVHGSEAFDLRAVQTSLEEVSAAGAGRWQFEEEFAMATTDVGFKQLLTPDDHPEILISFLNTFVPAFKSDPVRDVRLAPVAVPALPRPGDKKLTFMDLHVVSSAGIHYIVEMQARRHILFDERALFYLCNTYGRQLSERQLRESSWYRYLHPVIALQILDYDSNRIRGIEDPEGIEDTMVERATANPMAEGSFMKHYKLTDVHSKQTIEHIQMVQVELPRYRTRALFPPQADFTLLEWWLSLLRHSQSYTHEAMTGWEASGIDVPLIIRESLDRLDLERWNPRLQTEYRLQAKDREEFATLFAVERKEGREEKAIEIAKGMLVEKMDVSLISRLTGLTTDDIEALREGREIDDRPGAATDSTASGGGAGSRGHE